MPQESACAPDLKSSRRGEGIPVRRKSFEAVLCILIIQYIQYLNPST